MQIKIVNIKLDYFRYKFDNLINYHDHQLKANALFSICRTNVNISNIFACAPEDTGNKLQSARAIILSFLKVYNEMDRNWH